MPEIESVRVFQGRETTQVSVRSTGSILPAEPELWYWEPADYRGAILFSKPYGTREEAIFAAESGGH